MLIGWARAVWTSVSSRWLRPFESARMWSKWGATAILRFQVAASGDLPKL